MTDDNPIIVEPVPEPNRGQWTPVIGPETIGFLSMVPKDSQDGVRDAAVSILTKSVPPTSKVGRETGLIVGYVQSGKTMSFETVTALAHDNAFQIVIVVAGTAKPLLDQSTNRLQHDLRIDEPNRVRRWIQFKNPSANDDTTIQTVRDVLDEWRDPHTPKEYKRTVLITVLKNYRHLQNLADLMSRALDMQCVPALIIDDEADQASLNTKVAQGEESTTYRHLMALRQALPTHTYLQYTATPQAPLLINIIDSLSPNFVQVLEPGETYAGGRKFFADEHTYVRIIPSKDVPTNANSLSEPPDSLLNALRVFMVGVTVGFRQNRNIGNRSMLVHPSHLTTQHQEYYNWVRDIFDDWKRTLNLPGNDPDKQELIEDFRTAYEDLAQTAGDTLPVFDELVPTLHSTFRHTRVLEVNARGGRTPPVAWRNAYGWILVGGQAMDRGFTVEGLTVTYMPRGIGVGNADTVQQRARFFGYKQSYLGYCRVYLEQGTLRAFQTYVEHEEDIRTQLKKFQDSGQPLDGWKRAFVLDTAFRPCRHHVLEFDYIRGHFSDDWVTPRVVLSSDAVVQSNQQTIGRFIQDLAFTENDGHPDRTDVQRHSVCKNISLRLAFERLLIPVRITGTTDSQRNTGLLLQLRKALEDDPDEVCTIYRISPATKRHRGIDENGKVTNLFQGESPVHPREQRGEVYPGDRAIHDDNNVTIQIHMIDLKRKCDDKVVAKNVPVLAVWVPTRLARAWITQDEQ